MTPGTEAAPPAEVRVRAGEGRLDYPVLVGPGLLRRLPAALERAALRAHRWAVVTDTTVAPLYGTAVHASLRDAGLDAVLLTFPAGERHKTRDSWARLGDGLLAAGVGRDGCLVAVGGGVTGDLAGFVAATWMRGIPWVMVPTSLVAMVDSSVGGKTGVDLPGGKNLVGAFHPPALVATDPEAVATLPLPQRAEGLVEAVKHGAILDADYLEFLEGSLPALLDGAPRPVGQAVLRSVAIKAEVVGRDEREGGYRQVLNFGHTLGHALEAASGWSLSHGAAVGIGMVLEARLGEALGVTAPGTSERLARIVVSLGLPAAPPPALDRDRVLALTGADKKARAGRARFVLLEGPGRVSPGEGWSRPVPVALVMEVLGAGAAGPGVGNENATPHDIRT